MYRIKYLSLLYFIVSLTSSSAQCPGAMGDQTTYGNNQWIGYVYDGANNFTAADYQGYITESEIFDNSFCGDDCNITINGCTVYSQTFSIRYKMRKTFTNAIYRLTIGGDDGVRLSMDGGSTPAISAWNDHSYITYSTLTILNGSYDMIYEYYENDGGNRVSFSYDNLGSAYGGMIGNDQTFCSTATVDPAGFTTIEPAMFLTGAAPQYQWQVSANNSTWLDIAGETSLTYDVPAGFSGTRYYRRRAFDGASTYVYTNTVTVTAAAPSGDQVTYGNNSWIGYVYDGRDSYASSNYIGEIFESRTFDESFGGSTATFNTSGCSLYAETFTVRFRMRYTFACGDYTFTIGGDDGVRLSIDGGNTYIINDYGNHGYQTTNSAVISLNGSYDLVLDFFEDGGDNRVSFSYASTPCVLPVELAFFDARADGINNVLTWSTASEKNNAGFVIERSTDGKTYDSIGWTEGHGTTFQKTSYTFRDRQPVNGLNYYRLKQVDYNSAYEYSKVRSVRQDTDLSIQIYPNPATEYIEVRNPPENYTYSMIGSNAGRDSIPLRQDGNKLYFSNVSPGIYILLINTGDGMLRKKVIVRR